MARATYDFARRDHWTDLEIRRVKAKSAVRTGMVDILVEHALQSKHSRWALPTQRLAWAFAFGAWRGVRITATPSSASTCSNTNGNFSSLSQIRNFGRERRLSHIYPGTSTREVLVAGVPPVGIMDVGDVVGA